jgi:hypothetical protein
MFEKLNEVENRFEQIQQSLQDRIIPNGLLRLVRALLVLLLSLEHLPSKQIQSTV